MKEFIVNGNNYSCTKLDAMAQHHIIRRLAPVLAALAPSLGLGESNTIFAFIDMLKVYAALPDKEAEYCVNGLLACVKKQEPQGLGWSSCCVNGVRMFADMEHNEMIMICWEAGVYNFSGFLDMLPPSFKSALLKQEGL